MSDIVDTIVGFLGKVFGCWLIADTIVVVLSVLFGAVTGGLSGALEQAIIAWVFGLVPLPFNLLIGWYHDPLSVILQVVLTVLTYWFLFAREN